MSADSVAIYITKFQPLTRVVIVLCGALIIHLTIGTYHTFGNMLPYIASYMHNYTDPDISLEQLVWVPNFQGCFPFAMVIGGVLSDAFGPRLAALIGCSLMTAGVLLSSWTIRISFSAFTFTYGIMFGFGQGIAYVTAVNTAINWAPDNVGVISGIVAAGFGVSSSIFAPIQTSIINPENHKPTTQGYFLNKEVVFRVPSVFFYLGIIYGLMQLIGLVVMCDPVDETAQRNELKDYLAGTNSCLLKSVQYPSQRKHSKGSFPNYRYEKLPKMFDSPYDMQIETDDGLSHLKTDTSDVGDSLSTGEMLRNSTFYFLFAALFCCSFYGNMYYNLYKTFGETFIDDDLFMAYAFSSASFVNAFARISWGYLADRTNFQNCLKSATFLATILLLTMPLTPRLGKWPYFVWLNLMFVCLAATHALFITASVKCFGTKRKSINYGYLILSTTLSAIVLSLYCQYLLPIVGYGISFFITALSSLSAHIIISLIGTTPHGYRIM